MEIAGAPEGIAPEAGVAAGKAVKRSKPFWELKSLATPSDAPVIVSEQVGASGEDQASSCPEREKPTKPPSSMTPDGTSAKDSVPAALVPAAAANAATAANSSSLMPDLAPGERLAANRGLSPLKAQEGWSITDLDEEQSDSQQMSLKRPLGKVRPPLPPLAPLGSSSDQSAAPLNKLPPLSKPPGSLLARPAPGRLAMLDSPSKGPPTGRAPRAESGDDVSSPLRAIDDANSARSPLRELNATQVQRFDVPPSPDGPTEGRETRAGKVSAKVGASGKQGNTAAAMVSKETASQGGRRTRWASELVRDSVTFEACPEKAPLEYKANLASLDSMRHQRRSKGQVELSFRELVAELDMGEGGEGLSCLNLGQQQTWGQLLARN